jgi:hypothetical protein
MAASNPEMQECDAIVKFLMSQNISEAFATPVDWEFYGLTDYPEIIKKPMDLGTIQGRLDQGKYPNAEKFAQDVRLVWRNAMTYNRPDSEIYRNAEKLGKLFDKRFQSRKSAGGGATESKAAAGTKRKRADGKGENISVTRGDRVVFSKLVDKLSSEELGQLVDMVQRDCPTALNEEDEKEIEIEINAIDSATLMNLIEFAQNCVTNSQNKKKLASGSSAPSNNGSQSQQMSQQPMNPGQGAMGDSQMTNAMPLSNSSSAMPMLAQAGSVNNSSIAPIMQQMPQNPAGMLKTA